MENYLKNFLQSSLLKHKQMSDQSLKMLIPGVTEEAPNLGKTPKPFTAQEGQRLIPSFSPSCHKSLKCPRVS